MFKQNFERICFEKKLPPTTVCQAIGLTRSTYSNWDESSVPRRKTLEKLSEYLQVSIDELLGNDWESHVSHAPDLTLGKRGDHMFWDNFVQLCTQQGKNPNPVAKELGIASGTVTEWRKGRIPQSVTLRKISDYFGVSVDALLGTPNADQKDVTTFKLNFIRLCNARGESPSSVCQKVGLSNAAYSQWTDETIPRRATLIKIADYLQVTVEELTANDAPNVKELEHNAPHLTSFEHDFILEYRKNPSFAAIVDAAYSAIHPQQAEDVSS